MAESKAVDFEAIGKSLAKDSVFAADLVEMVGDRRFNPLDAAKRTIKNHVDDVVIDSSRLQTPDELRKDDVAMNMLRAAGSKPEDLRKNDITPRSVWKNIFGQKVEDAIKTSRESEHNQKNKVENVWIELGERARADFKVDDVLVAREIALDLMEKESRQDQSAFDLAVEVLDCPIEIRKALGVTEEVNQLMKLLEPKIDGNAEMGDILREAVHNIPEAKGLVVKILDGTMDKYIDFSDALIQGFALSKELGIGLSKESRALRAAVKGVFVVAGDYEKALKSYQETVQSTGVDVGKADSFLHSYANLKDRWLGAKSLENTNKAMDNARHSVLNEFDDKLNDAIPGESDVMAEAQRLGYKPTDLDKREQERQNATRLLQLAEEAARVDRKRTESEVKSKSVDNEVRELGSHASKLEGVAFRSLMAMKRVLRTQEDADRFIAQITGEHVLPTAISDIFSERVVVEFDKLITSGGIEGNIGDVSEAFAYLNELIKVDGKDRGTKFYATNPDARINIGKQDVLVGVTLGMATEAGNHYWEIKNATQNVKTGEVSVSMDAPAVRFDGNLVGKLITDVSTLEQDNELDAVLLGKANENRNLATAGSEARKLHEDTIASISEAIDARSVLILATRKKLSAQLAQVNGDRTLSGFMESVQTERRKLTDNILNEEFVRIVGGLSNELGIPADKMTSEVLAGIAVSARHSADSAKAIANWIENAGTHQEKLLKDPEIVNQMRGIAYMGEFYKTMLKQASDAPIPELRSALIDQISEITGSLEQASNQLAEIISTRLTEQVPMVLRKDGYASIELTPVEYDERIAEVLTRVGLNRGLDSTNLQHTFYQSNLMRGQLGVEKKVDAMARDLRNTMSFLHESHVAGALRSALKGGSPELILSAVNAEIMSQGEKLNTEREAKERAELADGKVWKERTFASQEIMTQNVDFLLQGGVEDTPALLADLGRVTEAGEIEKRGKILQMIELNLSRITINEPDQIAQNGDVSKLVAVAEWAKPLSAKDDATQMHYSAMIRRLKAAEVIQNEKKKNE